MDYVWIDSVGFGMIGYDVVMGVDVGKIEDYYFVIFSFGGYVDVSVGGWCVIIGLVQGVIVSLVSYFGGMFFCDCEQFFVCVDKCVILVYIGYDYLQIELVFDFFCFEFLLWLMQLCVMVLLLEMVVFVQCDCCIVFEFE